MDFVGQTSRNALMENEQNTVAVNGLMHKC